MERDEERVKQWLMTLNKHTFLLNDGALRVAKKRRAKNGMGRTSKIRQGSRDEAAADYAMGEGCSASLPESRHEVVHREGTRDHATDGALGVTAEK